MRMSSTRENEGRRVLAVAAAVLLCAGAAQAQMGPGGGMGPPGGGMGGGMGPPGGGKPAAAAEPRTMTLDDLMPPDPWRIWQERLRLGAGSLRLSAAQEPVFQAFLRELDEAGRLNATRVMRGMRRAPAVVSAVVDVGRDLRQEADDARDWLAAVDDLAARWAALRQQLSPEQQAQVDALYRASREAARPRQGPPPGGGGAVSARP